MNTAVEATNPTELNYPTLSGADLIRAYNSMILIAVDLGLEGFKPVTRFSDHETGVARCTKLRSAIRARRESEKAVQGEASASPATTEAKASQPEAEASTGESTMGKRKSVRKTNTARVARPKSGVTLKDLMEAFNSMVPAALKLGIKGVKTHTSLFETTEKGKARVAWLEKEIARAEKDKAKSKAA